MLGRLDQIKELLARVDPKLPVESLAVGPHGVFTDAERLGHLGDELTAKDKLEHVALAVREAVASFTRLQYSVVTSREDDRLHGRQGYTTTMEIGYTDTDGTFTAEPGSHNWVETCDDVESGARLGENYVMYAGVEDSRAGRHHPLQNHRRYLVRDDGNTGRVSAVVAPIRMATTSSTSAARPSSWLRATFLPTRT